MHTKLSSLHLQCGGTVMEGRVLLRREHLGHGGLKVALYNEICHFYFLVTCITST